MNRMRRCILLLLFPAFLPAQKSALPAGPGKEVVERICGQCHAVEVFTSRGNTRDGWSQVVTEMISRGAQGSDDEFGAVVDYLTNNFPPKTNVNQAGSGELQNALGLTSKDADAIVDYRKQHGNFKNFDDLKKVPSIDSAKLDSVKQKIGF